jgi:hypothetical protein
LGGRERRSVSVKEQKRHRAARLSRSAQREGYNYHCREEQERKTGQKQISQGVVFFNMVSTFVFHGEKIEVTPSLLHGVFAYFCALRVATASSLHTNAFYFNEVASQLSLESNLPGVYSSAIFRFRTLGLRQRFSS